MSINTDDIINVGVVGLSIGAMALMIKQLKKNHTIKAEKHKKEVWFK